MGTLTITKKVPSFFTRTRGVETVYLFTGENFVLDLGGGCSCSIKKGNYTNRQSCHTLEYLLSRPDEWTPHD